LNAKGLRIPTQAFFLLTVSRSRDRRRDMAKACPLPLPPARDRVLVQSELFAGVLFCLLALNRRWL
jgi:hypothetical protein